MNGDSNALMSWGFGLAALAYAALALGHAADGAVVVKDEGDVAGQADKGLRKLRGPGRQAAEVRGRREQVLHG